MLCMLAFFLLSTLYHLHSSYPKTYAELATTWPVLGVAALVLGTTMNRCPLIVTTDWRPDDNAGSELLLPSPPLPLP